MTVRGEADAARAGGRRAGMKPRGVADIVLAVLVVAIVATMIVPLPVFLLDILLTVNLSLAVVLLLVALYVPDAIAIASFPTILLVTTLYRLSLDIAATRLILGRANAGDVIRAFGQFVVKGNYVVGGVIFVILTIVQFLVIAKGSERVAEVAARFTLDAMPGKQMTVDAELRAGAIDQTEARRRRRLLGRESSFYGAMDGAMKFVKGDAIASIIIAFVNIAGGLAIGVGQRGMAAGEAMQRYGLLTIGEGLVAQIPALIISTAAGILVTRVASEEPDQSLGKEISNQLIAQPRALGIAAVLLGAFAITPGMPALPFLVMAGVLAFGARAVARAQSTQARANEVIGARSPGAATTRATDAEREREQYKPVLTPIAVDVGEGLASLVESSPGQPEAPLRALIPAMRDALFHDLGVPFPGVRVRVARGELESQSLVIRLHEIPAVERELHAGMRLVPASAAEIGARAPRTIPDTHPSFGTPAAWVDEAVAVQLEREGYVALAHDEVVIAALGGALRSHASQFIGIQETQTLVDALETSHPALVRNTIPKPLTVTLLAEVLRRIAEEGISIRNLRDILEGLAPYATTEKDPVVLADLARQALRRHITHAFAPRGRLAAWTLAGEVSDAIREAIVRTPSGNYLRLDPQLGEDIRQRAIVRIGPEPAVLLADADIRRYVWLLLETKLPLLRVISHPELAPGTMVESMGMLLP